MSYDKRDLIEKMKNEIRPELTKISYDTWIKPLDIKSIEGNHIVFTATSDFQKDFIEGKYKDLILNTLSFITNKIWTFSVVDISNESKEKFITSDNIELAQTNEIIQNANPTLKPEYTFETFVVGENNEFANAAALAVCNKPGETYNPLFIYGGVGLRKNPLNACNRQQNFRKQ